MTSQVSFRRFQRRQGSPNRGKRGQEGNTEKSAWPLFSGEFRLSLLSIGEFELIGLLKGIKVKRLAAIFADWLQVNGNIADWSPLFLFLYAIFVVIPQRVCVRNDDIFLNEKKYFIQLAC